MIKPTTQDILELSFHKAKFIKILKLKNKIKISYAKTAYFKKENLYLDLKRFFEELKYKPKRLILVIPRHQTTMRYIKLPSFEEEEIKNMLKLQIFRYLPYRTEEVIFGYKTLKREKEGSLILLIAMEKNTLNSYLESLRRIGITVKSCILSSEALFYWAKFQNLSSQGILIDLDSDSLEIVIFSEEGFVFSRSLFLKPEELDKELNLCINTFQKEVGFFSIKNIFYTGITQDLEKKLKRLSEIIHYPQKIISQKNNTIFNPDLDQYLNKESVSSLIGAGFSFETKINLLPEDILKEKRIAKKRIQVLKVLLGLIMIIGVMVAFLGENLQRKRKLLRLLDEKITSLQPEAEKISQMRKALSLVKDRLQKGFLPLEVLSQLYKISPSEIKLNLFVLGQNKSLLLKGSSSGFAEVFKFVKLLEDCPYFDNVKIKRISKRKAEEELADFEIVCEVK